MTGVSHLSVLVLFLLRYSDMKKMCPKCNSSDPDHVRNGHYTRRGDRKKIQRYRCKRCGKEFSQSSFQDCYRQRLRKINGPILRELISGSSLRRTALLLEIDPKTVAHRLKYLAARARKEQARRLKSFRNLMELQFDEMESFEHSKLKPVAIGLLVVKKTRMILGVKACSMRAKGLTASKSREKYGYRPDHRKKNREELFLSCKECIHPKASIETDDHPHYPECLRKVLPGSIHTSYQGRRGCVTGFGELKALGFDPLFSLNHTAAMLRYSISRLIRRTWVTTKKLEQLQNHLDIYVNYHNRLLVKS